MDYVKIIWEIEDGYAGSSRPQRTIIPKEEWLECETDEERRELAEDYVDEDFNNSISWYITQMPDE